jgi:hypothetical protein
VMYLNNSKFFCRGCNDSSKCWVEIHFHPV